jgi:endonuclease/exonuclease/phosphatase family metal-dependent hydrolase
MIRIATINILFEMEFWQQRRELLIAGLKSTDADIIGLQEINTDTNTVDDLAQALNMPYIYQVKCRKWPFTSGDNYGIAIISRLPFLEEQELRLPSQGRSAQYVRIEKNGQPYIFCNGHYLWWPGSNMARMQQFKLLADWLGVLPAEIPQIIVGDFNATPDTAEIGFLANKFNSAYAKQHGREPEYTCPTPLMLASKRIRHELGLRAFEFLVNRKFNPWQGTLDYIFLSQQLQVLDCQLILTEPSESNKLIYPSDHFGLVADLQFNHGFI